MVNKSRRNFLKKGLPGILAMTMSTPAFAKTENWYMYFDGHLITEFSKPSEIRGFTEQIKEYFPNSSIKSNRVIINGYVFGTDWGDEIKIISVPIYDTPQLDSPIIPRASPGTNKSLEELMESMTLDSIKPDYLANEFKSRKRESNLKESSFSRNELLDITNHYGKTRTGIIEMLIDFAHFYGISRQIIPTYLAHVYQESSFNPYAHNKGDVIIKRKGRKIKVHSEARGIGQFIKSTAKKYGLGWNDAFNPAMNIDATTRYFKNLLIINHNDAKEAIGDYVGKSANLSQYEKHIARVIKNLNSASRLYNRHQNLRAELNSPRRKSHLIEV